MTPNDLDIFKVKNTKLHATYTPWGPYFLSFRSTMSRFWVMAQFSEKVHRMTPNDLDMFKVKIPTCMLHTPPRPKFLFVSLYDEPFLSYRPILRKVHQMTPNDMFKVKNNTMHATYTPEAQILIPFTVRWAISEL